ncbi:MAG: hypothetical protein AAGG75_07120 [Bacteroidota bacterium]
MKWHKFDKTLQKELLAHQSEVDINAIWAAIEPEVDTINTRQQHRRRGIIWWGMLAGLLLLGSTWFLLRPSATPTESATAPPVATNEKATTTPSTSESKATAATTLSIGPEQKSTTTTAAPEATAERQASTDPKMPNPAPKIPTAAPTREQKQGAAAQRSGHGEIPPVRTTVTPEVLGTADAAQKTPVMAERAAEGQESLPVEVAEPLSMVRPVEPKASEPGLSAFPGIAAKDLNSLSFPQLELPSNELRPLPGLSSRDGSPYSLDIHLGIAFPFRDLSGPNDTATTSILEQREQTESPLEAIQLGILLNRQFKSGFEISAGLHFTRITERFDYNTTLTQVDSIEGIVAYHIQLNGDTIPEFGQVAVTTETMIRKKFFNRYQLIDIPIMLGYRLEANNFTLGLRAGVMANVALFTRGRILGDDGLDVNIKNSENDLFKSNVTFSYYVSFMTAYEIAPGIQLQFAPYAHFYPRSFTGSANPLSQKYTLVGLNAGIRYQF